MESLDGKQIVLSGSKLTRLLEEEARTKLKLVFLNACMTDGFIQAFTHLGIPAIIATNAEIGDTLAKKFSSSFYRLLVSGSTLQEAFDGAKSAVEKDTAFESGKRKIDWDKKIPSMGFPWQLYVKDDAFRDWKLEDEALSEKIFPHHLNFIPPPPEHVIGREEELQELETRLEKERSLLLVNGLGGIGKTTLAQHYLHQNKAFFDHILWLRIVRDPEQNDKEDVALKALASDLPLFKALKLNFDPKTNFEQRAEQILFALHNLPGKNLLVMDNAGTDVSSLYQRLPHGDDWKVILTSRERIPPFPIFELDTLNAEKALELFYTHYTKKDKQEDDVKALLEHIGYHTLTIELLAKLCQTNFRNIGPKEVLEKLQNQEFDHLKSEVWTHHSNKEVEVYGYLLSAFFLTDLTEEEKHLLLQFSVMPSIDISFDSLAQLLQVEPRSEIDLEYKLKGLIKKGWLNHKTDPDFFICHQLIQEVVRYQLEPKAEDLKPIIDSLNLFLRIEERRENPAENSHLINFVETLLQYIDEEIPPIATLKNNLATLLREFGYYLEAKELLESTLPGCLNHFGNTSSIVIAIKSNLGLVYWSLGENEKAVELLEHTLQIDLLRYGENHVSVARSRSNLALVYKSLHKFDRAIELFEKALDVDLFHFGVKHPNVGIRKSNLAMVYFDLNNFKRAARLLEDALLVELEETHPSIATMKSNLALVYKELGRFEESKELLKSSLSVNLKNWDETHPSVERDRSALASLYQEMGLYPKAAQLLEKVMTTRTFRFGETSKKLSGIVNNLAIIYKALGEYEKAAELLEKELRVNLSNFEESHPNVIESFSNLAVVYQDLKHYVEAAQLLEKALSLAIVQYGKTSINTAAIMSNLGKSYDHLGNYERATKLLEKALELAIINLGENHPNVGVAMSNLAMVYNKLGNYDRAECLLGKAIHLTVKRYGDLHPSVAIKWNNLANIKISRNDYSAAKIYFEKAFYIWERVLGEKHPHTLMAKRGLDLSITELGKSQ